MNRYNKDKLSFVLSIINSVSSEGNYLQMKKKIYLVLFSAFFAISLIVFGLSYYRFVSQMIHEESISHLAEIYGQSNTSLKKMMDKNWGYLHIWSDFLGNINDEQQTKNFLKKIKQETNFKNFYFINREGNYKTSDGETGFIELKSGLSDVIINKKDIAVNSVIPGQPQIMVFATPVSKAEFQGFEYEAIAISYDNDEIVNTMKVSSFDGHTSSFIIHADGRVIIENTSMEHHVFYNFLAMLKEFSTLSETQISKLRDDFKNRKSISTTIDLGGEKYYFLTESTHFDDWMIVNLVPVSIVNASMMKLQYSTMLLVFLIMIGLTVFMISLVIRRNQIKLYKKDKQILYRDKLFSKLSESVDDVFLMLDAENFRVDYVSPNIEKLLGIPQKKIQTNFKEIEKIVKEEDNPLVLNKLSLMKLGEKGEWKREYVHQKTKEMRWFHVIAFCCKIEDEKKYIVELSDRNKYGRSYSYITGIF